MNPGECFLKGLPICNGKGRGIGTSADRLRIASKRRCDNLHETLQPDATYWCHFSCISTYTSQEHIYRPQNTDDRSKRKRRSEGLFIFKEDCLVCGEKCLEIDPKHPNRWRPYSPVLTVDFKDVILQKCVLMNDVWGNDVKLRVQGAAFDLCAVGARYHRGCLSTFYHTAENKGKTPGNDDAFDKLCASLLADKSRFWNSLELANMYNSNGGHLSRRALIDKLLERVGPDLISLSGPGVANILMFKSKASKHMKFEQSEDDDIDTSIRAIAKVVKQECEDLRSDNTVYDTRIRLDDALACSSSTLLNLLLSISPKLERTPGAAMIGNMVTGAVTKKTNTTSNRNGSKRKRKGDCRNDA